MLRGAEQWKTLLEGLMVEEFMELVEECERHEHRLSAREADFLASLREQLEDKRNLSKRQAEWLTDIWERVTK